MIAKRAGRGKVFLLALALDRNEVSIWHWQRLTQHDQSYDGSIGRINAAQNQLPPEIAETTDRERTEEALRESEERFRCLVQEVKDYLIIMLDPQGRIVSWNQGAERLLGYNEAEISGQSCGRFMTEDDRKPGTLDRELQQATVAGRVESEAWMVRMAKCLNAWLGWNHFAPML